MSKIHIKRIVDSLGINPDELSGENYQSVMTEVIYQNTQNIGRAVNRMSNDNYEKQIVNLKKRGKLKEKNILLPNMEDVLPKRSISVTKSAEAGKQITDTLKDKMNKSLRDTLKQWQQDGNPLEIKSGRNAGKINPELINAFEKDITGVFKDYTRRDPETGVPKNIKAIAITEIRSNIDATKDAYHREFERNNSDILKMVKTWIHNGKFSKNPRKGHQKLNGVTIPRDGLFKVPGEKGGFVYMSHPHEAEAPAEQVINCSCDCLYKAVLI